ncbi:hypothetical protein RchiOBHm_Chr3g0492641 [Rosa chinensis]|uniref:Uncharacterized protein n=1 Tax=Rosa chinensis TaxID=74649 RepID=A0A2P6RGJ7_ROSCH|nr:hypothetical protein RchiOBHm_Chr3g0492641 [Rosa chinensis]
MSIRLQENKNCKREIMRATNSLLGSLGCKHSFKMVTAKLDGRWCARFLLFEDLGISRLCVIGFWTEDGAVGWWFSTCSEPLYVWNTQPKFPFPIPP